MIKTVYSVDFGFKEEILPSSNLIRQLMIKEKLEEYGDIDHHGTSIQFETLDKAMGFVDWIENTNFPEFVSNSLFRSEEDMIKQKGSLDASAYLEMDSNKKIELFPSRVTDGIYEFWKNVNNLLIGKMYVLRFEHKQTLAFEHTADLPTIQALVSNYTDDNYPFVSQMFSSIIQTGTITASHISTNPALTIDLDNTTFVKNGKTVDVETT